MIFCLSKTFIAIIWPPGNANSVIQWVIKHRKEKTFTTSNVVKTLALLSKATPTINTNWKLQIATFYHSDTWPCSLCTQTSRSCCQTSGQQFKRSRKQNICKPSHNNNAEKQIMSNILHKKGEFLHSMCWFMLEYQLMIGMWVDFKEPGCWHILICQKDMRLACA